MKTVLKAPKSMLLTLRYDEPLSNIGFNFNLRRYVTGPEDLAMIESGAQAAQLEVILRQRERALAG